jgi:hypothetical protein
MGQAYQQIVEQFEDFRSVTLVQLESAVECIFVKFRNVKFEVVQGGEEVVQPVI